MFFELFADTGAKERGPKLGPSLTRLSQPRSWSRYPVLGAISLAFIAKSCQIFKNGRFGADRVDARPALHLSEWIEMAQATFFFGPPRTPALSPPDRGI